MPNIEFLAIIAVVALVAFIGFRVVRDAANEPLMAALIARFRSNDEIANSIEMRRRLFGWIQTGDSVVRTSGTSKLAVADDSLFIAQLPLANKLIPTLQIPLESISKVDCRFFWSAMSRFDVFEIDGVSDGKLLLPVGLVSRRNPTNNGHSAAT